MSSCSYAPYCGQTLLEDLISYRRSSGFRDWKQHLLSNLRRASAFLRAFEDPSAAKLCREGMLLGFINNLPATSSPPSLHRPNKRVIEFSLPLGDPNLNRSIRRGTNTLLFLISLNP